MFAKKETHHEDWLAADTLSPFEYTNHARFESMRDYPRRKNLYRKHVDIGKDYERKARYYKQSQKLFHKETDRHIQKVEDRFTDLLRHTFDSNRIKTQGLLYSYNKWMNRNSKSTDFDHIFDDNMRAMFSSNGFHKDIDTPIPGYHGNGSRGHARVTNKLPSQRSVSVDHILQSREKDQFNENKIMEGRLTSMGIGTPQPDMVKSLTSVSVPDVRNSKQRNMMLKGFKHILDSNVS